MVELSLELEKFLGFCFFPLQVSLVILMITVIDTRIQGALMHDTWGVVKA